MSRSRMFDDEGPASPRTTIVGGRPPEGKSAQPPVPTGIDQLLRLASVDGAFRAVLVEKRGDAAGAAGVTLTASERAILKSIPAAQLEAMATLMPPPSPQRRGFLLQAAASAVVALGGAALTACDRIILTMGIQPDMPPERPDVNIMPPERPDVNIMPPSGGAAPDFPPERPVYTPTPPGGAAPDMPPPRPEAPPAQQVWIEAPVSGGGAAPDRPPERPTRGIQPDMPPSRPQYNETLSEGGAAPDMPPRK